MIGGEVDQRSLWNREQRDAVGGVEAIDESSLSEQEGTLAGDNTLLVLFADESRLERWVERFEEIRSEPALRPEPVEASS